jgi:Ni,Fe-hydrogenase I small subunit
MEQVKGAVIELSRCSNCAIISKKKGTGAIIGGLAGAGVGAGTEQSLMEVKNYNMLINIKGCFIQMKHSFCVD